MEVTVSSVFVTVILFIVGQAIVLATLIITTHVRTQTKIATLAEQISNLGKASEAHEERRIRLEDKISGISRTVERHATILHLSSLARASRESADGAPAS